MAFQLLNSPSERGDYLFKGRPLVFSKCYQYFSTEDIEAVKVAIWKFARTQPRGYILVFENYRKQRLYAYDNLSQNQMNDLRLNRVSEFDIQERNWYMLMPACDHL